MKPASPGLLALLASRQFYAADLYQFTLIDGTHLNYCGGDQNVTWEQHKLELRGDDRPLFRP